MIPVNRTELTPLLFIERAAQVYAKRVGAIYGRRRFTYGEIGQRVRRLATALRRAGLQSGDPFGHEGRTAIDESCAFCAVLFGPTRNVVVVAFVGLSEVRRVSVGNRAFFPHPVKGRARVEAAGECDADPFTGRKTLKDVRH